MRYLFLLFAAIHSFAQLPAWMLDQIHQDLRPFSDGITKDQLDECIDSKVVKVRIADNILQVLNGVHAKHPRLNSICRAIQQLAQQHRLPNIDFLVALDDSLPDSVHTPCLTFAKQADQCAILVPDFEALDGYADILSQVRRANAKFPWRRKKNLAMWRGGTTGGHFHAQNYAELPRSKLVQQSLRLPSYVDARFTDFVQIDKELIPRMIGEGYLGNRVSISDQLRYKYQILVDGNSCAYSRAYWQLWSSSLIFKQESSNIQWYYQGLKPWEHFIPVASDFSDLPEKLEWARRNDAEAKRIGKRATEFAQSYLKHDDILNYLYYVLVEYGKLFQY